VRTPWAFIGVDLHKAFGRDGGLRIDGAEELVPLFNDVAENGLGDEDGPPDEVLISYEEHVPGNLFLSKTHNIASGDTVVINGRTYKTWPWHGMTGTREVELFDGIDLTLIDAAFRKGYAFHEHPYSAFGGWLMVGSVQYPMSLEEYLKKKDQGWRTDVRLLRRGNGARRCDEAVRCDHVEVSYAVIFETDGRGHDEEADRRWREDYR